MKKGLLLTVAACSLFSVSANAKIWRPYIGVDYYYGGKMMNVTNSFDGTGVRFGVGAQVNITDSLGVRAMGRYVLTDVEAIKSIKEFTVGLRYTF